MRSVGKSVPKVADKGKAASKSRQRVNFRCRQWGGARIHHPIMPEAAIFRVPHSCRSVAVRGWQAHLPR